MSKPTRHTAYLLETDRRRRRREILLIPVILLFVAALTFVESRIIRFGADLPVSNTILLFILININMLLLVLLIFLVFRNLVKLFYDRRRKATGARLRTRLVLAFMALTLLPTTILFFFSINFISASIEFWFNAPVERALQNSLDVGRRIYDQIETDSQFFMERVAYQINANKLLNPKRQNALDRYIQVVQREFNIDAVEVYSPGAERLTAAFTDQLDETMVGRLARQALFKTSPFKKTTSVTENVAQGELVKTIGTVPYGIKTEEAQAFIVITQIVPSDLFEDMESISRGFEEYQQIKLLKKPIQLTYYISLSIVALLVLFCAIWFGFYLAKSITIPIMELVEGTRRVADGDLGFSVTPVSDDEIGSLVTSFNKMTRDLRISREQLELSARILRQQNMEIEERRQYMEIVLKNVSAGVISVDAEDRITTINTSAEHMLNLSGREHLNRDFKALLTGQFAEMASEILNDLRTSGKNQIELSLKLTVDNKPKSFLVSLSSLKDDLGHYMGVVLVFDDLTELERAQRMAAWREVARRIAHEVKNPLTPISLSAQRLRRKYADRIDDSVFEECTRMIIDHVELIRNLVNEFSAFARFPTANPKLEDLPSILEEAVALFKEGHESVQFTTEVKGDLAIPALYLDRQQIKQAMINLVDNAIAAMKGRGHIRITVLYLQDAPTVRIEVADDGPGIPDEHKSRLFEPDFSTKKTGMGIGLSIVSTIVADHSGSIRVEDNHPRGAKFVILLPVGDHQPERRPPEGLTGPESGSEPTASEFSSTEKEM
jgi:two-component system nitrogen regulation sensor histidine kinase NtrY